MEKKKITEQGREILLEKLEKLKEEKIETQERLQITREFGDLKENSEYHEAKGALIKIESEIDEIKTTLANSIVVSSEMKSTTLVSFGSIVTIENLDSSEKKTYTLVSDVEADIFNNLLSENSPIGQCMLGKKKNETFSLVNERGTKTFKIIKIE